MGVRLLFPPHSSNVAEARCLFRTGVSTGLPIQENQVLIDWAETRGNKEDDERGVYILNVDENVEDAAFKSHFAKFGPIEKASQKNRASYVLGRRMFDEVQEYCGAALYLPSIFTPCRNEVEFSLVAFLSSCDDYCHVRRYILASAVALHGTWRARKVIRGVPSCSCSHLWTVASFRLCMGV